MTSREYNQMYNRLHKEDRAAKRKEKAETDPYYVAGKRIRRYKQSDEKYRYGGCTLTPQHLVDVVWKKGCCYCGETDWHNLGCDRIDNRKPHTPDNIVCSCRRCNEIRQKRDFVEYFSERFMDRYTYD